MLLLFNHNYHTINILYLKVAILFVYKISKFQIFFNTYFFYEQAQDETNLNSMNPLTALTLNHLLMKNDTIFIVSSNPPKQISITLPLD